MAHTLSHNIMCYKFAAENALSSGVTTPNECRAKAGFLKTLQTADKNLALTVTSTPLLATSETPVTKQTKQPPLPPYQKFTFSPY